MATALSRRRLLAGVVLAAGGMPLLTLLAYGSGGELAGVGLTMVLARPGVPQ
jgi:hypothetical protein